LTPFSIGSTSCTTVQSLGPVQQHAPDVRATMCENIVFVCFNQQVPRSGNCRNFVYYSEAENQHLHLCWRYIH